MFVSFVSFGMTDKLITDKISTQVTVYVCGESKIYHKSKSHSALDRCKTGITKMTESKAKGLGKRICKCKN